MVAAQIEAVFAIDLENVSSSSYEDSPNNQFIKDAPQLLYVEYNNECDISSQIIGRLAAGTSQHYFGGVVSEIMVYDRALSLAERQMIKSHLSSKWDITLP